jgi:hypothetical protein
MKDRWGNQVLNELEVFDPMEVRGKKIIFLCGSLSISGGTNLILNYAYHLQSLGAKVTVSYLLGDEEDSNWHPSYGKLITTKWSNSNELFDLAIFTWWRTVIDCSDVKAKSALYFIQSLETRFARNTSDIDVEVQAAATYLLGIPFVTVAGWINKALYVTTGQHGVVVRNGIDKGIFNMQAQAISSNPTDQLRVLIEGPFSIPMKAVDETFELVKMLDQIEVWHVNPLDQKSSLKARTFKRISQIEMPTIYRSCDLILKMSRVEGMFGPPLEAFHCGATALVSRVTGYSEYIEDGHNSLSVEVDDFASAFIALKELRDDNFLLQRLKIGALETASAWPSIQDTAMNFAQACRLVMLSPYEYSDTANLQAEIITAAKERYSTGEGLDSIFGEFLCP